MQGGGRTCQLLHFRKKNWRPNEQQFYEGLVTPSMGGAHLHPKRSTNTHHVGEEKAGVTQLEMLEQGDQEQAVESAPRTMQVFPRLQEIYSLHTCI